MRPFKLDRPTVADPLACKGNRELTLRIRTSFEQIDADQ
jgi:hypothetical protein